MTFSESRFSIVWKKQSYQLHYHLSKATKYIVCFNNAISKNIIAEIQIQNLFQN